jgi:hypothetical protein
MGRSFFNFSHEDHDAVAFFTEFPSLFSKRIPFLLGLFDLPVEIESQILRFPDEIMG